MNSLKNDVFDEARQYFPLFKTPASANMNSNVISDRIYEFKYFARQITQQKLLNLDSSKYQLHLVRLDSRQEVVPTDSNTKPKD